MTDTMTEAQARMAHARAARVVEKAAPAVPEGHVSVRVMKRGHDRIFTGETVEKTKDTHFPRFQKDDVLTLPLETATKYEDDGWIEVLP